MDAAAMGAAESATLYNGTHARPDEQPPARSVLDPEPAGRDDDDRDRAGVLPPGGVHGRRPLLLFDLFGRPVVRLAGVGMRARAGRPAPHGDCQHAAAGPVRRYAE